MRVPFLEDGIIAQFDGYDRLEELDWDAYRARYGDIQRLDRILEAEGDTINRYKASKQADVLMLFYLFSSEELARPARLDGLRVRPGVDPADHRLLHAPHLARLDAQPRRPFLGAGAQRPRAVLGAADRGAGERPARHPGRHDGRGHPPRRHGRQRRPDPARPDGARVHRPHAVDQPLPARGDAGACTSSSSTAATGCMSTSAATR